MELGPDFAIFYKFFGFIFLPLLYFCPQHSYLIDWHWIPQGESFIFDHSQISDNTELCG
jgi:hypothetical protein